MHAFMLISELESHQRRATDSDFSMQRPQPPFCGEEKVDRTFKANGEKFFHKNGTILSAIAKVYTQRMEKLASIIIPG